MTLPHAILSLLLLAAPTPGAPEEAEALIDSTSKMRTCWIF